MGGIVEGSFGWGVSECGDFYCEGLATDFFYGVFEDGEVIFFDPRGVDFIIS